MKVSTIGFTKTTAESFFSRLERGNVRRIVDVRLNNVSQLAGFAKRDDLAYFCRAILGIDYVHVPDLAPTQVLLSAYRGGGVSWDAYERAFLDLIAARRVEHTLPRDLIDGACLLCSEARPHHCHRRLVAEYLRAAWGDVEIVHL